ncbi:MAG: hypothetical protein OXE84_13455 [Rhodobacteraceae bacterium]|nr:hypothetical protein [Paracoccaceae bacterium]
MVEPKAVAQVVKWLEDGDLKPRAMISEIFAVEDAEAAFAKIRNTPSLTTKVQLAF